MKTLLLVLLFAYLAVALLVSCLSYFLYAYEVLNQGGRALLREKLKGRIFLRLPRLIATALISQLFVGLTYPLGYVSRLWNSPKPPGHEHAPILFIHGLYHNPAAWIVYRWVFRANGWKNLHCFKYSSWSAEFPLIADKLMQKIDDLAEQSPGRQVSLVGHSLGGLLSRHCASRPETKDKIAAVVTLGAPHQGSKLSALGLGKLARSLIFRGELIQYIESMDAPPHAQCLSLFSCADNFVLPEQGLLLNNHKKGEALQAWEERCVAHISHIFMLYHSPTIKEVQAFLEKHAR